MPSLWLCNCNFPSPLGEDIVQNEVLDVVFIDTVNLRLSTVLEDSIVTSSSPRHLIGYHQDDAIGSIRSKSFFTVSLDSVDFPDEDAEYLSAEFELFYDGYYYYDTTRDFTIGLSPIAKELELDDDGFLYNITEVDYREEESIGELTFIPRPNRNRTISIPIDDEYGRGIFDFALNEENDVFFDDFYDRYPGFVLEPDTSSTECFLGFSLNSRLLVNYSLAGEEYEMIFPASGVRFNQIINNRGESPLVDLTTLKEDVSSRQTGNEAYLNSGFGMAIKVEIPFLQDIREILNDNFITEATLVLRPVRDTYGDLTPLPDGLIFHEVDQFNREERQLDVTGFLSIDDEFGEDTQYRVDITGFIQEKISEMERNEDAILVRGNREAWGITVDRLVVGDSFSDYEATLELFILDYIIENE